VRYRVHRTIGAAVMSHVRWLRRMGAPAPVREAASVSV
jgi:hypothetical protein